MRLVQVATPGGRYVRYTIAPEGVGEALGPVIGVTYDPESRTIVSVEQRPGRVRLELGPWHDSEGRPTPALVVEDEEGNELARTPLL